MVSSSSDLPPLDSKWQRTVPTGKRDSVAGNRKSVENPDLGNVQQHAVDAVKEKRSKPGIGYRIVGNVIAVAAHLPVFSNHCMASVGGALRKLGTRNKNGEHVPSPVPANKQRPAPLSVQELQQLRDLQAITERDPNSKLEHLAARSSNLTSEQSRSRQGLVALADQVCSAGILAADKTIGQVLARVPNLALMEVYEETLNQISDLQSGLELRPALNGLSPEKNLELARSEDRVQVSEELAAALRTPVSAKDEHYIEGAKEESRKIEQECQLHCSRIVDKAIEIVRADNKRSPATKEKLILDLNQIKSALPKYLGDARADLIHSRQEWSQEKSTDFVVKLQSRAGDPMEVVSSFKAAGPPWSSAMPRNRRKEDTCVANFFETRLTSAAGTTLINQTRSATVVEFGLDHPEQRAEATRANVKQILDHHAQTAFDQPANAEAGIFANQPLVLKYQHVMLFTPDRFRHLGSRISQGLVYRADDERLLTAESGAANDFWNGKKIKVEVMVNGKLEKRWIQYDIRSFNFPCNRYQERLVSGGSVSRMVAGHALTDEMNAKGLNSLLADGNEMIGKLKLARHELVLAKHPPEELVVMNQLESMVARKNGIREEMSTRFIKKGKPIPEKLKAERLQIADSYIALYRAKRETFSPEGQAYLDHLAHEDMIIDLLSDVNDLIKSRAYMAPAMMDNNRYAIAARVLLLGELLDIHSHFGCRSGKDRTGMMDDFTKLLAAETQTEGRVPSFFENEKWENHQKNTQAIHMESGNASFNPRANLGGMAWINMSGARLNTESHQGTYDDIQSASGAFYRPSLSKGYQAPAQRAYRTKAGRRPPQDGKVA